MDKKEKQRLQAKQWHKKKLKDGIYFSEGQSYRAYFVHQGKKVDRSKFVNQKKRKEDGTFFANYKDNMSVIEPKKIFDLKYRADSIRFTEYILNLIEIEEEYKIEEYENCVAIICLSLVNKKKERLGHMDKLLKIYSL